MYKVSYFQRFYLYTFTVPFLFIFSGFCCAGMDSVMLIYVTYPETMPTDCSDYPANFVATINPVYTTT